MRLLQLPVTELEQAIKEEIEKNPLLEAEAPAESPEEAAALEEDAAPEESGDADSTAAEEAPAVQAAPAQAEAPAAEDDDTEKMLRAMMKELGK